MALIRRNTRRRMRREYSSILNLSESGKDRIISRFFIDYLRNKTEVFFYPFINSNNIGEFAELEGAEHLRTSAEHGKGAVLIHSHMGNPQMLMPAIGHRGFKLCQVGSTPMDVYKGVREITGGRTNFPAYLWLKLKDKLERSLPVKFIHLGQSSLKEIFHNLDDGACVAMAVDGVNRGDDVRDFMGRRTNMFSSGPARVALSGKCDLLPVFVLREGPHRHRVVVEAPIPISRVLPKREAAEEAMMKFINLMQVYVRRYPYLYGRFLGFHNDSFFLPQEKAGEAQCE